MIRYEIILEAKLGNKDAIEYILKFYEKKIKKFVMMMISFKRLYTECLQELKSLKM